MTTVPATDVFEGERRRLFTLAYGLLGSRAEAEDIMQDAWLRWQANRSDGIRDPAAWLTTATTHLALDHLRSARVRRETYPGVWLPEPIVETRSPEACVLAKSDLSVAFLFLLEQLGPEERAAFVLREVFEHSYREIGDVLGKSKAACRQLVKRGREKVRQDSPADGRARRAEMDSVLERFVTAVAAGDEAALLRLLAPHAVLYGDGGGKAASVVNPIYGAERIVRFIIGLRRKYPGEFSYARADVNGSPGLLVLRRGEVQSVTSYEIAGGRIVTLFHVVNPDKILATPVRPRALPASGAPLGAYPPLGCCRIPE